MYKACLLSVFIIGAVGAFDNSMNVIYSETLITMEENPVGTFILCNNVESSELKLHKRGIETSSAIANNLYVFVLYKSIGTMLVVGACLVLIKTKYRVAVVAIAIFQGGLFLYLNFSDTNFGTQPGRMGQLRVSPIAEFAKLQKNYYL